MTLQDWRDKYPDANVTQVQGSQALLYAYPGKSNREAQNDLFHLSDYYVSGSVSGYGYVIYRKARRTTVADTMKRMEAGYASLTPEAQRALREEMGGTV